MCFYLCAGQWVQCGNTGTDPSNLAGKDVSAAETDTFISENIMRHSRAPACLRTTLNPSKSTTIRSRIRYRKSGKRFFYPAT